ncbi:unnamed protein product, partial [Amoebophrya sp. A25]
LPQFGDNTYETSCRSVIDDIEAQAQEVIWRAVWLLLCTSGLLSMRELLTHEQLWSNLSPKQSLRLLRNVLWNIASGDAKLPAVAKMSTQGYNNCVVAKEITNIILQSHFFSNNLVSEAVYMSLPEKYQEHLRETVSNLLRFMYVWVEHENRTVP